MTGLRERKKQQTAEAIIREAGRLFSRKGFQAATMEEIARAADVSPGTLYNYFGTKATVLLAHVGSQVGEMTTAGRAILDNPPPDALAAVQKLTRLYVDRFAGIERELLRELIASGFAPSSEVLPELIRLDYVLLDQLTTLLDRFEEEGALTPGIAAGEAAMTIFALIAAQLIMYISVDDMTAAELRRAVARQIDNAFTGLGAQER